MPPQQKKRGLGGLVGGGDDPEPEAGGAPATQQPDTRPESPAAPPPSRARASAPRPAPSAPEPVYRDTPVPARRRRRGPARDKMTVDVRVSILDGLDELIARDGGVRYREVEGALVEYLTSRGIAIAED